MQNTFLRDYPDTILNNRFRIEKLIKNNEYKITVFLCFDMLHFSKKILKIFSDDVL
jgi:hypothetical protein